MPWKQLLGALIILFVGAFAGLNVRALAAGSSQDSSEKPSTAEKRRADQIERLDKARLEAERQRADASVATLRRLQGAWQLTEYTSMSFHDLGRQEVAFLLVGGEFLTIEVHMGFFDDEGTMDAWLVQTGTYRLNFNQHGELMALRLIGSMDDGQGYSAPQTPGEISVYKVEISNGVLTLINEESSRFRFEPVATGVLTERLYEEIDWLPGSEGRAARETARAIEAQAESPVNDPANSGD